MKRYVCLIFALIFISCNCVTAFAGTAPPLPPCEVVADCATFKTFIYTKLNDEQKKWFKEAFQSNGAIVSGITGTDKQSIVFISFKAKCVSSGMKIVDSGYSCNPLSFKSNLSYGATQCNSVAFTYNYNKQTWVQDSTSDVYSGKFSYLLHSSFEPKLDQTSDYNIFTHYKSISWVTDEDELADDNGILDWLHSFWDKLKNMFLSIFIPPEGYFESWISDIKNAWNSKMQNLNALKDLLKSFFEDMSINKTDTSLMFNIPANHFYSGSPSIKTDLLQSALPYCKFVKPVLNGFIGILTLIACYKRLVKLFDH